MTPHCDGCAASVAPHRSRRIGRAASVAPHRLRRIGCAASVAPLVSRI